MNIVRIIDSQIFRMNQAALQTTFIFVELFYYLIDGRMHSELIVENALELFIYLIIQSFKMRYFKYIKVFDDKTFQFFYSLQFRIILFSFDKIIKSENTQPSVTEDELKYIVESIEEEGVLEQQESELVRSALDFDEITISSILWDCRAMEIFTVTSPRTTTSLAPFSTSRPWSVSASRK